VPGQVRVSPLALTILGLLEAGPMHPYRMERLLREWGKDQTVRVGNRANLSSAIRRLEAVGAVVVHAVERDGAYPERTVYAITPAGHELLVAQLEETLSSAANEYPEFPVALGYLMMLSPERAAELLELRAEVLGGQLRGLRAELRAAKGSVPRIALIESEYQIAMTKRELDWVASTAAELRSGELAWGKDDFALPDD
jgi:DNA-binding PadR family transcriptional regulator